MILEEPETDAVAKLPAEKTLKSHSLPEIGRGRTSRVYDMGEGKVLKLYKSSIPTQIIRQELILTGMAHGRGLPVPKAYGVVRLEEGYGIIMDKAPGKEMEALIRECPDRWRELIRCFAQAVKKLHGIEVREEPMPDLRAAYMSAAQSLCPSFCSKEEAEKIRQVFERLPEACSFVHGDCHPGNGMLRGSHLEFIDMTLCGKGHPVFDLTGMYSHYVFLPSFVSRDKCLSRLGMDRDRAEGLHDFFLRAYLGVGEDRDISSMKEWIRGIQAARICLAPVILPGVFSQEILGIAKGRAISFAEEVKDGKWDACFVRAGALP